MDTPNHDYGLNDIVSMFGDALYGNGGVLPNLSFMPSRDPSEYDNIAWQAKKNQQELFKKFLSGIVGLTASRRAAALSGKLGLGKAGMSVFNGAMALDPRSAMSMIGHHGGADAVRQILSMGNSMAYARGARAGGVLDPYTLNENLEFASTQGGLAYANNFNIDGSINSDQTRGLSLSNTGYVIGRVLSDRSTYSSWEERMSRGDNLTESEKSLTASDIKAFTSGEKMDPKKFETAANSFNEDIKKLTREINGVIASVSKMTGSCDEAIRFLDSYTNGNLTSSTESAKQARSRAAKLAANIRVAAADSGLSPEHLFGMAMKIQGSTAISMFQNDPRAIAFGASKMFSAGAGLGALAMGDWASNNPQATGEQKTMAEQAINLKIQGYYNSGMGRLNALAGRMMTAMPNLNWDEYRSFLKAGDAEGARKWLNAHGGQHQTDKALLDPMYSARLRNDSRYAENIRNLDIQATAGQAVEANRFAKYRQVMETEEYYRDLAAGDDVKKRESLGSVYEQFRKTLLSDKVLLASGWKQSELKSVRDELSKYADTESIMDRIVTKGGDAGIETAYEMIWDDTSKKLESTNKSVAESYRREIRENVGFDRVTPEELEQARKDVALARERDDIAGEHAAALRGDGAAMTRIIKRGGAKLSDAILERMNESIAGRLSTPGENSSPEKIKLGKEEMADIQNKVQYEMSKPGNARTFEEIAKQVFKERYTENNPDIDLDKIDTAVNGDNSVKISFEDESFVRSKVLPDTPSESYVEKVSDSEASAKARQNIADRNRDAAGNRALYNGTTVGNMLLSKTVASLGLAPSIESASRKLGTSGEGELAVAFGEVSDARSAHDAQKMLGSSSDTSDFKKLTDDIGSRMKIISDLESELDKKGDGWKDELDRAVKNGDEESLNKLFGESASYKSLKDTGMSALEAGKIMSAGLDAEDVSKKEFARQNALLEHSISKGEGPKDDIAQILIKILNLIQSAIK